MRGDGASSFPKKRGKEEKKGTQLNGIKIRIQSNQGGKMV
jgi:hypothetical protein